MFGVAAEGEGWTDRGLDQVGEVLEIKCAPVLRSIFNRNRFRKSRLDVEPRTLRKKSRIGEQAGCLWSLALQERHHCGDRTQVGVLVCEHGEGLFGERVLLLSHTRCV